MIKQIKIDGVSYKVHNEIITGYTLKTLANISLDKKLVLEVENQPDIDIINDSTYTLKHNMKFFSELYSSKIKITIDGKVYYIEKATMTGSELKQLAGIQSPSYKLIREVKDGMDIVIEDLIMYEIEKNDMFFSMPDGINNGGC